MKRFAALLALFALLFPSVSLAAASTSPTTCLDRNEECSLGELMEINKKALDEGLAQHEHVAVLLEIITHLRRIITTFYATSQVSYCVDLKRDLRPGTTDAKTDGEVSTLQFFLTNARVYPGLITGYYGPTTADAVYEWQRENGIADVTRQTGVGKITRQKIREASCPVLD